MENVKSMIADIKGKLDELESELESLEKKAISDSGDANTEAERHRLALQDVLTDLQQRIGKLARVKRRAQHVAKGRSGKAGDPPKGREAAQRGAADHPKGGDGGHAL